MLGRVADDDLPGYVKAASVYVGPAIRGESFGIVLVEAMAAGRPIVASNIAGYRDVARDGVEAILVPPGDSAALASAVRRVLDDPALARSLGGAGARRAHDFAWDAIADRLLEMYADVIAEGAGRVEGVGAT